MTAPADWIAGARPKTLWASIAPVLIGTAAAGALGAVDWTAALLALGVGIALQVGSNYANDYSDGIRGTDIERIGPDRLVATGKARPSTVKAAAYLSFGIGALLGAVLVVFSGLYWLLVVGAVAIAAAWYYTGGSRPYGYAGWGEVSVLVFFGPVAVLGTMITQAGEVTWWALAASLGIGLYSVALLMVNNLRDIETDALAGKLTYAVKVGEIAARRSFFTVILLPIVAAVVVAFWFPWALLAALVALPSLLVGLGVLTRADTVSAPLIFQSVGVIALSYSVLLSVGLII